MGGGGRYQGVDSDAGASQVQSQEGGCDKMAVRILAQAGAGVWELAVR